MADIELNWWIRYRWPIICGSLLGSSAVLLAETASRFGILLTVELIGNLGPVATAFSIVVAAWVGKRRIDSSARNLEHNIQTLKASNSATYRDQWWKRMQWATDCFFQQDDTPDSQRKKVAAKVIAGLADDLNVPEEDRLISDSVFQSIYGTIDSLEEQAIRVNTAESDVIQTTDAVGVAQTPDGAYDLGEVQL